MEKKPVLIYILISLWIIIGILFLCVLITWTQYYFEQIESTSSSPFRGSQWDAMQNFSFILQFFRDLFIVVFAFLLAYGTFIKKSWSRLVGIMISSFFGFFIYLGIQYLGTAIIMDSFDQMFLNTYFNFLFITYLLMIFFVPCLLFILTRPNVKAYFEKTEISIPTSY